jgi:hypothetical protein
MGFTQCPGARRGPESFNVDDPRVGANVDPRRNGQAVLNTAIVIREFSRVPGVKKILSQLPADSMMNVYEDAARKILIGAVLLDAWRNPIIFVPTAGFQGVCLGARRTSMS